MQIIYTVKDIRKQITQIKYDMKTIAFIPTMGSLHEGHLELVRKAKSIADIVIVSIYVNPMQFGENEDFNIYPKSFEEDKKKLYSLKTDIIFAPADSEMYPNGKQNHVSVKVDTFDNIHCGTSRPQFFTGIATIITKLFSIITPDYSIFGEKDFQQLCVIKKLVSDLMLNIKIISIPTIREVNGLAISSRNNYFNEQEKTHASQFYKILEKTAQQLKKNSTDYCELSKIAQEHLLKKKFTPDYCNIVSRRTLKKPSKKEKELIILAACTFNKVRLIDNIKVDI